MKVNRHCDAAKSSTRLLFTCHVPYDVSERRLSGRNRICCDVRWQRYPMLTMAAGNITRPRACIFRIVSVARSAVDATIVVLKRFRLILPTVVMALLEQMIQVVDQNQNILFRSISDPGDLC